jgi:hypothetical protein
MEPFYKWTIEDVAALKKRAEMKEFAASEARRRARQVEQCYWQQQLSQIAKKLGLTYVFDWQKHEVVIDFADGECSCVIKGPVIAPGHGVCIYVWHKGSKGKLNKKAIHYRCHEVIPFIKSIVAIDDKGGET